MNRRIKVGSATLQLTKDHYRAAGGEAMIYVHNGMAYKLYHDPKKMLPVGKIKELGTIGNPHVMIPKDVVFDATSGEPIGFTLNFVENVEPFVKLVTKAFKEDNHVTPAMCVELVKAMQLVVADVHKAKCLVVDLNELNVLVNVKSNMSPFFIDADSYATPNFRATAIMDSIRDRRVSVIQNGKIYYNADTLSDWFSWGVLAFWLYINAHPYRGRHPKYSAKELHRQMDDGMSIFHPGVRMPPTTNPLTVIPARHLEWFKAVFGKGERSVPPLPDSIAPIAVPASVVIIHGTDKLDVKEIGAWPEPVILVYKNNGVTYVLTNRHIYVGQKEVTTFNKVEKLLLATAEDGGLVVAALSGSTVYFTDHARGPVVGSMSTRGMFARNGAIYTVSNGKLIENTFTAMNNRLHHRTKSVENLSQFTATLYDGCVIQDLLGVYYLAVPYAKGACCNRPVHELKGYRVVDAKAERNVVVVLAEKGGKYDRFIIVFDKDFRSLEVRKAENVAYDTINFTVVSSGLCLLLTNPGEVELFTNAKQFETLSDPPFDSAMRLFNNEDGVFFINGNSIHQIKRK